MNKIKLLVATTNKKKLAELQDLLKDFPFELITLKDLSKYDEVEETGKTFEENAKLKALGYACQSGLLTLGEDSGLCCDALEGAPGIYSARFAGEGKSDSENNSKLLKLLEKVPDNCRGAHYECAIAIAERHSIIGTAKGEVHGTIAHKLIGTGGFGYDPLFFYPPFGKTFGEVDPLAKHKVSHRSAALARVRGILNAYLSNKVDS